MIKHDETCLCKKRTLEFRSDFKSDVVTKIYCPACVERAPDDAIIFELCEPGEYNGTWGVRYNKGELKHLDKKAFRDTDDYYLSLLVSDVCGPVIAGDYKKGGLCRVFGFKKGPDAEKRRSGLSEAKEDVAQEKPKKRKRGAKSVK